jgi:hypothetical protein
LAISLFIVQSVMADSDLLTVRFLISGLLTALIAVGVMGVTRRSLRTVSGPAPEPVVLVLAGLVALSLWAAAWWLMDLTNHELERAAGVLERPQPITGLSDAIFGLNLQPAAYELEILFAVVLLPLAQGWLVWGLVQAELTARAGRWRASGIAGGVAGAFMSLAAVQNISPALPWGAASLGGYILVGAAAALLVGLTGSPWAGFAAHGTFAYASFMWRDDLFRALGGKDYLDPSWLTVILLGGFAAFILFQVIRFRAARPAEPPRVRGGAGLRLWLPLVLLFAGVVVMVVLDIGAR